MKKLISIVAALGIAGLGTSCTTMYDSYGNPQTVVSPEGAAFAAIAAGVVGYALADDNHGSRKYGHSGYRGNSYGHRSHGGYSNYGGGYGGGYCR